MSRPDLFTVHPKNSLTPADYSKHINVMCFWMVRDKLGVRSKAPVTFWNTRGSLMIEVDLELRWDDQAVHPFIDFIFADEHIKVTSYDGTVADDGGEEHEKFKIDYETPNLIEAVRDAAVKWAESCKRIPGRWADALKGKPSGYFYIRR